MTIIALQDRANAVIYSAGLVCCSACVQKTMTPDDVASDVNRQLPTGLDHGWSVSSDATFRTGQTNPCQCPDDENRMHYLLVC